MSARGALPAAIGKKKTVALVCCDNGLGHLTRQLVIANLLENIGHDVTLFCDSVSLSRLAQLINMDSRIRVIHFSTGIDFFQLVHRSYRVPYCFDAMCFRKFDIIISDNLPEILHVAPHAILFANFFWHQISKDNNKAYYQDCESILADRQPLIIGFDMFAMPGVRAQYGFKPIELIDISANHISEGSSFKRSRTRSLFVTGGNTGANRSFYHLLIERLAAEIKRRGLAITILTDLKVNSYNKTDVRETRYTLDLLPRLDGIICRPGLGTICQALKAQIPIFPIFSENNQELEFNSKCLQKHGLSIALTEDLDESIEAVLGAIQKDEGRSRSRLSNQAIGWGGANELLSLIHSNCRS